jgi:transcriptional regulator with XRE-family HTH domain
MSMMGPAAPSDRLQALAAARGDSLAALSRMLGRNVNYLQQWVRKGSPRVLTERDRRALADYFGVDEAALGGPPARAGGWRARRLDVAASAGPGALNGDDLAVGAAAIPPELARSLGLKPGRTSVIRVHGDSMAPGLMHGDELLVDEAKRLPDARGAVFVVRLADALLVKRVRRVGRGLEVTSDNPDAAPVGPGTPEVVGQVVWQMRRVR